MVSVQNLRRDFRVPSGVLRALDGVSFEVAEGETLGIVGESGCGKSTLARLIVGLDRPTAGTATVAGIEAAPRTRADRLKLSRICQMVFQDPFSSLNPRLRVGDIVAEPLIIHGTRTRAQRERDVLRLLARVGLPRDAVRRFPHEFSGGQRQRIGIARALALKPRVLVADEPVSALDVSVQAQILNLLADLQAELGLTVLLVSHDLQVVEWMSDRVLVMYLGRVVELGPRDAVFDRPAHPYTRALLAAAPKLEPGAADLDEAPGEVPSPLRPPPGCHFHPRCPLAQPRCEVERPEWRDLGQGHGAACHEAGRHREVGSAGKQR